MFSYGVNGASFIVPCSFWRGFIERESEKEAESENEHEKVVSVK